ncbi:DUF58 domain-containing protein [Streptomyces sp. NPDC058374]|uniref:DUF58 domain-containing protein n=1 Tax=Streptomyces sp. NPDC058374 TaxID=3346466 RepID=UPI00364A8C9D
MALTGRTAWLAALGTLPVALLEPSWLGITAVNSPLAVAMMCDFAWAAPARKLRFTRSGDTSVRQGERAETRLHATNDSSRRLRAVVRGAWPPSNAVPGSTGPARHRMDVPASGSRELRTPLRPTRRGEAVAHGVTVRSYGPLGLVARQTTRPVPGRVRVLPPFHSRRLLPAKTSRLRELDGRTSALGRGEGTEIHSLRGYVPGDDARSIDWRATARQSSVAVRTWRAERDRRVLIVLDTGRTSAGRVGNAPRLEAAMDAALLLVASVADPRLAEMTQARGTAEKVYQAAAAHKAQAERARTAGLLRRRGVTVVDAPPAELPSALADAYLAAKATGKL